MHTHIHTSPHHIIMRTHTTHTTTNTNTDARRSNFSGAAIDMLGEYVQSSIFPPLLLSSSYLFHHPPSLHYIILPRRYVGPAIERFIALVPVLAELRVFPPNNAVTSDGGAVSVRSMDNNEDSQRDQMSVMFKTVQQVLHNEDPLDGIRLISQDVLRLPRHGRASYQTHMREMLS